MAFLDIRTISGADVIKLVMMGVSHNHVFTTFPSRIPRNKFTNETKEAIRKMVLENRPRGEICMKNDVLCNKDVLCNAMRGALEEMRTDKSRALRDAAASSDMWLSEIQLTVDKIFQEKQSEVISHKSNLVEHCSLSIENQNECRSFRENDRMFSNGQSESEISKLKNVRGENPTKKKDIIECSVL